MEYIIELLKSELRYEYQCQREAKEFDEDSGYKTSGSIIAFEESKQLAEMRIPQMEKVLGLIRSHDHIMKTIYTAINEIARARDGHPVDLHAIVIQLNQITTLFGPEKEREGNQKNLM